MEATHARYRPLELSTWVDDIRMQVRGPRPIVRNPTTSGTKALVRVMRSRGLKLSPTSQVLASSGDLLKQIHQCLKDAGVELQAVTKARDLGLDISLQRRSTTVVGARMKKTTKVRAKR
eukprot:1237352-Pyramimonas_sp.AAC.1